MKAEMFQDEKIISEVLNPNLSPKEYKFNLCL